MGQGGNYLQSVFKIQWITMRNGWKLQICCCLFQKSVSVYIHKEIQTEPHIAENFRNSSTNSLTAKWHRRTTWFDIGAKPAGNKLSQVPFYADACHRWFALSGADWIRSVAKAGQSVCIYKLEGNYLPTFANLRGIDQPIVNGDLKRREAKVACFRQDFSTG